MQSKVCTYHCQSNVENNSNVLGTVICTNYEYALVFHKNQNDYDFQSAFVKKTSRS